MAKKGTKGTKQKAGDGFLLHQNASMATGVDPKLAENKRKEEELKKSFVGYAKWDFLKESVQFGFWNMRALNSSEVQKILESFAELGCNRFSKDHLIPLVVKKEYIKPGTYHEDFPHGSGLRALELNVGIPASYQVAAASGQHRVAALGRWVQNQASKSKNLEKETKRLKEMSSEELGDLEISHYNGTLKPQLDTLKAILGNEGYWGVAIYDSDVASEESLTYLSTNQRMHVYKETPEEGLIQRFKEMVSHPHPAKRRLEPPSVTKGTALKQWELLSQDYVKKLLGYLIDLGPHFVHTKSFKLSSFHEDMMSSYGGILAYVCIRASERLHMCFNNVEVTKEEVEAIEQAINDEDTRMDGKKKLNGILGKLRSASFMANAATTTHMELLNEVFEKHYDVEMSSSYRIGSLAFGHGAISSYRQDAAAAMRQALDRLEEDLEGFAGLDPKVVASLRTAQHKVRLVLMSKWTASHDFSDFPLFTSSLYVVLRRNLKMIHRSLLEVSSWWTPFIRMKDLHPKEWMPGSASADMIRAILAHPAYDIDARHMAVANIVHMVFDSYAAFLHLEGELAVANIPLPPSRQNELESLFGGDKVSRGSTKKSSAKGKGKSTAYDDENDEMGEFIVNDDEDDEDGDEEYAALPDKERRHGEMRNRNCQETAERMKSLGEEISAAMSVLNAAKKINPESISPVEFGAVWSRSSRIPDDTLPNTFRGQSALPFHTFEWSAILGGSRARSMRNLARIVIYHDAMVSYYRPRLLEDPNSAAATIRYFFDTRLAPYIDKYVRLLPVQSSISNTGLVIPSSSVAIWPDGFHYASQAPQKQFPLDDEVKAARHVDVRARQTADLQRIVNAMTSSHIVSAERFRFSDPREITQVDNRISTALHAFIEAVQINCFRQRHPAAINSDSTLPVSERLHIFMRVASGKDVDDINDSNTPHEAGNQSVFTLRSREEIQTAKNQQTCHRTPPHEGGEPVHEDQAITDVLFSIPDNGTSSVAPANTVLSARPVQQQCADPILMITQQVDENLLHTTGDDFPVHDIDIQYQEVVSPVMESIPMRYMQGKHAQQSEYDAVRMDNLRKHGISDTAHCHMKKRPKHNVCALVDDDEDLTSIEHQFT